MPSRSHIGRRSSRQRGINVWTAVRGENETVAAGGVLAFDIVADSDWVPAGGTSKATLLSIRGWMSMVSKTTTGSFDGGTMFAYVGMFDEDTSSPAASLASTYTDEDILWTGGGMYPFTDAAAAQIPIVFDINIKAQRKIRNGMEIRMVVASTLATTMDWSFVLRGLLRRGS